jgi:hypothetical protein
MGFFDLSRLEGPEADQLAQRYRLAEPFPHTVLEDFVLAPADDVAKAFPDPSWDGWIDRTGTGPYQPGKSSCRDIELMPPLLREMINELSQPRFLGALSTLTGIPNLLPDPFLHGGGLQFSLPGGKLLPHTDFHIHPHLKLFRRANLLVYLNPNWKRGDGGEVGLFNLGVDRPAVSVGPSYGTCVIFTTDHRSVHGVTPISENAEVRRSIALYYYTVEGAEVFSGDRETYWYAPMQGTDRGLSQRARVAAMRGALEASKTFMRISYRLDPQHSIRLGESHPD